MAGTLGTTPQQIVSSATATVFPSSSTDGWKVGGANRVRAFIAYGLGVTACVVRLLVRNRATGAWHGDATTEQLDPLTPASGNDVRVWNVSPGDEVSFQIVSVGGGTVTVSADVVDEGVRS